MLFLTLVGAKRPSARARLKAPAQMQAEKVVQCLGLMAQGRKASSRAGVPGRCFEGQLGS